MKKNEDYHQKKLVLFLTDLKIEGKIIDFFAIENENKFSFKDRNLAIKLESHSQAMGKNKGASDICIILQDKVVFIEMKDEAKILKSGKKSIAHTSISKEQIKFLENINTSNVCVGFVCYGYNDAENKIKELI